jgi:hypothetical protein
MESQKTTIASYESPGITVVGTVSELTQDKQHKYHAPTTDFLYPEGQTFDFS